MRLVARGGVGRIEVGRSFLTAGVRTGNERLVGMGVVAVLIIALPTGTSAPIGRPNTESG